jgi:hypothetical protein
MNGEHTTYTLASEPQGPDYRLLLDWLLDGGGISALLVVRPSNPLSARGETLLAQLECHGLTVSRLSEWPGTRLFGHTANVYRFALNAQTLHLLKRATSRLFGWCQPFLPEDLCVQAPSGRSLLASTSHEGDAFLELTPTEARSLQATLPNLQLLRE